MGTCTRQISTLLVAALWLDLAIAAPSPAHGTLTMAVFVDNRAGVTPAQLTAAERVAGNIFRKIGVEIMWCEDSPPPSVLVLHLVSSSTLQNMGLGLDVLGLAVPRTRAVSIMYDRVTELAVRR